MPPVAEGDGRIQPLNFGPLGADPLENQLTLVEKQGEIAADAAAKQAEVQSQQAEQQAQLNKPASNSGEEGSSNK